MPGGLALDSTQSYIAFSVVKLVGYSLFALYLNTKYSKSNWNFLLVGVTRTLLGMLFGVVVGIVGFWALELALTIFLVALIPVRFLEWWILLRMFYDRKAEDKNKLWEHVALGVLCSFVLDIPAIFGFIVTGGFWIC